MSGPKKPPLIAHVIHALSIGGLENGLVNIINRMPVERYRHAIVCLTGYDEFASRIKRDDVRLIALNKRPGKDIDLYRRCWRAFRELQPAIVHTRNLAALEMQIPAFFAGVPARVHGEHGRGFEDQHGLNRKHQLIRRAVKPFVNRYIALSAELERYLLEQISVSAARVRRICNGVDVEKFQPGPGERDAYPEDFSAAHIKIVGAVGRLEAVKDPLTLVRAFTLLLKRKPESMRDVRLVWIGDGPQCQQVKDALNEAGLADLAWFPGARDDVPGIMRGFDIYVLPSLAEGISNTLMEAMATGLPVVATQVGGNGELVNAGKTGILVAEDDPEALASGIERYLESAEMRSLHGLAGRERAAENFSLDNMVSRYMEVYDELLR